MFLNTQQKFHVIWQTSIHFLLIPAGAILLKFLYNSFYVTTYILAHLTIRKNYILDLKLTYYMLTIHTSLD